MKRLFLVLALAFTVQAQAQDEIPTPEAFANDCRDDLVLYMQQDTETVMKLGANPEMAPRLQEDMKITLARATIKAETCDDLAEMLGEDYVIQLNKVTEDPEVKLAAYKLRKALEKMALQLTPNGLEENQLSQNTLTEEELIASVITDFYLTSLRYDYIVAIRQKVSRNWIKPVGSGKMPLCEVHVVQGPGGIILDVDFGACGGSTATYRASIENAVYMAEPLPSPGDPELFERELNFFFNPSVQ